jgi:uncharacterized protein with von Willebrand factor type A (vWA) domain
MSSERPGEERLGGRRPLGGVVHAYQKYDPQRLPSPRAAQPDAAGAAMEHLLRYGSLRNLTPEQLANAIKIDPSQIAGLGPSLEAIRALLEERKRKILATYETQNALKEATRAVAAQSQGVRAEGRLGEKFARAARERQLRALRSLWYEAEREDPALAAAVLRVMEAVGEQFEVEELDAKYDFTGRTPMDVPKALAVKEELETIDRLLKQLEEAMKNAQIGIIDLDELQQFVEEADIDTLRALGKQVEDLVRDAAERQGLETGPEGLRLTPKAYKLVQGRILSEIFRDLAEARSGRHTGPITGEGAVELPTTRPYEFGDSVAQMDAPQSFVNALLRSARERGPGTGDQGSGSRVPGPLSLRSEDIEIHKTRNTPKAATCVLMDMSGSMQYMGQYVHCKRMAIALDGLIRTEYPGDFLACFEVYSVAKRVEPGRLPELMPKPVTIRQPVVRLKVDMSRDDVTEGMLPPHFTNIQHGMRLARQVLAAQDTPNRQIVLITDGLPTAHFEGPELFLLYPPDPLTERATMREAMACQREGIVINIFLVPSWSQTSEDVAFAHRLAETTRGRVFFTGGEDLDRFVLWDYLSRRRSIIA